MWSQRLKPYVGAERFDTESFREWWMRVSATLPHVPENVAEHWIYRHFGHSPYEFLPLSELRFERETWSLARLDEVTFGSDWRWTEADLGRLDNEQIRDTPLASMMIDARTWPEPIIVLDNPSGLGKRFGRDLGRWHLIEGHQRLTYLRCLAHKNEAKPQHDVWVTTVAKDVASSAENPKGNVGTGYLWQKLSGPIETLVVESGTVQERLNRACGGSLFSLGDESFPQPQREMWRALNDGLFRHGSVAASTAMMSDREASNHARTLLELYEWVRETYGAER
jgi:hypothetical protein